MTGTSLHMESLSVLRDNSLLLTIAYEHLCEEQQVVKIGKSIDKNMERLREDILNLRKEFPGKLEKDIETEGILQKIQDRAQAMFEPSDELLKRCASGELGKELESDVISITNAINMIKPRTPLTALGFICIRFRPLSTTERRRTPVKAPIIVPYPPDSAMPPMTDAATVSSVKPEPRNRVDSPTRPNSIQLATPARKPLRIYAMVIILLGSNPEAKAASRFPPESPYAPLQRLPESGRRVHESEAQRGPS